MANKSRSHLPNVSDNEMERPIRHATEEPQELLSEILLNLCYYAHVSLYILSNVNCQINCR